MKIGHKIATTVEVLVAKGKILVANATVLVAISSPDFICELQKLNHLVVLFFVYISLLSFVW